MNYIFDIDGTLTPSRGNIDKDFEEYFYQWMEGKDVKGKIKVLDTPSGKVLQELVRAEVNVGISSRGMGSVTESNGQTMVEDDFQLICFDMVSEPSTPGAFMMKEAKDYKNEVFTKADRINRLLNEVLDDE